MLIGMFGTGSRDLDRVIRNAFANGEDGIWVAPRLGGMFQDAALTTPWTADGQAVGGYVDRSPRGYVLTQSTAPARPLGYSDRLVGDGADDYLSGGTILPMGSGSYFSVTVIENIDNATAQYFAGMGTGEGRYIEGVTADPLRSISAIRFTGTTTYQASGTGSPAGKFVVTTTLDRSGQALKIRVNGVYQDAKSLPADTTNWQPESAFTLFCFPSAVLFFNGAIHERVQVMRAPVAGEIEAIEQRLIVAHAIETGGG